MTQRKREARAPRPSGRVSGSLPEAQRNRHRKRITAMTSCHPPSSAADVEALLRVHPSESRGRTSFARPVRTASRGTRSVPPGNVSELGALPFSAHRAVVPTCETKSPTTTPLGMSRPVVSPMRLPPLVQRHRPSVAVTPPRAPAAGTGRRTGWRGSRCDGGLEVWRVSRRPGARAVGCGVHR